MAATSRALIVAFVAAVVAFTASTAWVGRSARSIDADALFISNDAAPGIEVLSGLRAELRAQEIDVLRAIDSLDPRPVMESRARMDALISRTLALPNDAHEATLLGRLHAEVRAFDEAAERAMAQARQGDRADARRVLQAEGQPQADAAATIAKELVDYNADLVRAAAERIERGRVAANRLALELDAISAALTLLAAYIAMRLLRQAHRADRERQAVVQRKADELEQFAGRVAHDILSPLSAVGIAMSLAERGAPDTRGALARGRASLSRVRGIVDALLEFARAGARPEPDARVEVQPVVAGLHDELAPFARELGAELHIEPIPPCAVACSSGVLLSLLSNLIRNAIKYLGASEERDVTLRVRRRRGRILFEVQDTGPGVSPTLAPRLFEPYVRGPKTGMPGIGLGLATVKRLVESHGGSVGVRPASPHGAIFWFELDEAEPPSRQLALAESYDAEPI